MILNGTVNSIFSSHHDKVMPNIGSSTSIAFRAGLILPVNLISFDPARSKVVGLGPFSGSERPYRCQPCDTRARKVTMPSSAPVALTVVRHRTACVAGAVLVYQCSKP